eukprot:m.23394 g.23394  ORF g.23394 m.23394 type:complete len:317 (+) comp5943_c0_seq1:199-1149(+)
MRSHLAHRLPLALAAIFAACSPGVRSAAPIVSHGPLEHEFIELITGKIATNAAPAGKDLFQMFTAFVSESSTPTMNVSVLDIGASTGDVGQMTDDEVLAALYKSSAPKTAWVGFGVEPMTPCFVKLEEKLNPFPNLHAINALVTDVCSNETVPFYAPSPEFYQDNAKAAHHQLWQLGSFDKDTFIKAFWYGEKYRHVYQVRCLTVKHLVHRLASHGVAKPHFLNIDTQGHDYPILKGLMDAGVLPLIMQYEDEFYKTGDIEKMRKILSEHNYVFFDYSVNTVAIHLPPELNAADFQGKLTTNTCRPDIAKMLCHKK